MECNAQQRKSHADKLLSGFDGLSLNIWCFESVGSTVLERFVLIETYIIPKPQQSFKKKLCYRHLKVHFTFF